MALGAALLSVFAWGMLAPTASAPAAEKPSGGTVAPGPDTGWVKVVRTFPRPDSTLAGRLREGGYVLVFRHALTDWEQRDAKIENFEDRSTQRNLSKAGRDQSALIGKAIAALEIPIGPVLSSPMWRCRDTAQIAFGRHETTIDLFRRSKESRAARVAMLSTKQKQGTNLVLVTHQDVLIPIISGLRREQLKEGDVFVVKPLGKEKFEILVQVTPDDWAALGAAK